MIEKLGIDLHLNTRVDADMLADGGFDNIIIATGISRVYRNWKASTIRRLLVMSTRYAAPSRLAARSPLWAQAALVLMLPISFPMTAPRRRKILMFSPANGD